MMKIRMERVRNESDFQDLNHQLVVAERDGDVTRVAALIDRGANCDATLAHVDQNGAERSAVFWAALRGQVWVSSVSLGRAH